MSTAKPMSTLRRPMPGMPATMPEPTFETEPDVVPPPLSSSSAAPWTAAAGHARQGGGDDGARRRRRAPAEAPGPSTDLAELQRGEGWRSSDYSSTRLVNFRIPVDLHDRYRALVSELARTHPRLRKASLTEIIIALLEEGPSGPDQAAGLIRRKRAAENAQEDGR